MKRSISRSNPATEPAPAAEPRGVSGSDGAVSTESVRVAEPGRPARPYALWPLLAERGIQQPAAPRWLGATDDGAPVGGPAAGGAA